MATLDPKNMSPELGSSEVKQARDVVTVACKMPNGIILRGFRKTTVTEVTLGGTREVEKWVEDGRRAKVFGPAAPPGMAARVPTQGGYALTPNIPADLWATWLEQNRDSELVRNNIIFASPRIDLVAGQSLEYKKQRSGLEPLTPDTDERSPKRQLPDGRQVPEIQTDQAA